MFSLVALNLYLFFNVNPHKSHSPVGKTTDRPRDYATKSRMAGGLVPTCYVSQVGTRPPAILDETLSEQSYTRYLEGKLRETFGFRCSAEAECFSEFALQYLVFLFCCCPHKSHSPVGKTTDRPRDYATKAEWQVVLCAYLLCFTSRHKTTCHLNKSIVRTKLYPDIWRANSEKHSASRCSLKPNVSLVAYRYNLF